MIEMVTKKDRGCNQNQSSFAKEFGVILCENAPEYEGWCLEHLPYELKMKYEYEQISQETRQKYLDLIHEGKSIGEAREETGISLAGATEIINRNIKDFKYLGKKAE